MKTRFGDINIVGNVENKGSVIGPQEFALTVTVGTGGDFPTINKALEELSRKYPVYKLNGFTVEVKLLAGYVMNEYVRVRGVDLSWITITGEDAETTVVRSVIPEHRGAFRADLGGFLPRIGQLFNMDSSGVGTNRHGIYCLNNSRGIVLSGFGVKNAGGSGLIASNNSSILADAAIFSNAGSVGVYALNASQISANGANASGAISNGVVAQYSSSISAYGANARKGASDSVNDFCVDNGYIEARTGTGGTNVTINTWSTNGFIRK